ncbi:MAG: hypothetical protein HY332_00070 [Chloroflexi bacterium]|nr:hypothetical protein [Chloroflexota bacterium]
MRPRATITEIEPLVCDTGQGRNFLFVVVRTNAGVVGVGEGSQNDQDAAVAANVQQLAPRYLGQDPLEVIESRGRFLAGDRTGRAARSRAPDAGERGSALEFGCRYRQTMHARVYCPCHAGVDQPRPNR